VYFRLFAHNSKFTVPIYSSLTVITERHQNIAHGSSPPCSVRRDWVWMVWFPRVWFTSLSWGSYFLQFTSDKHSKRTLRSYDV